MDINKDVERIDQDVATIVTKTIEIEDKMNKQENEIEKIGRNMNKNTQEIEKVKSIEEKIQERDNVIVQEIERIDRQIKNNQEKINKVEENLNKRSPEEGNEEQKRQWLRIKESLEKEMQDLKQKYAANQVET
ncbi:transmembrane and coiled-coil domain-containing protein 5A-like [Anoplophora glabripennis]|uniref:transmembrane and coiled-coil domain-containing protein 5A-like n=1 Tax=Anoplophora glabripennis TaxID=217634 RepID=UPI000C78B08C|nr:transmembrane and coiled-coil domain-containing protein 5A-like [Anoplophora glabripennis]